MKPCRGYPVAPAVFALFVLLGCAVSPTHRTDESTVTSDAGISSSKHSLIRVATPQPGAMIRSPLEVRGEARGPWYFEGDFPLILQDDQGHVLARGFASAQGKWMTTGFVPFTGTLEFNAPADTRGRLILQKDNPSGRRELDDAVVIPVRFE